MLVVGDLDVAGGHIKNAAENFLWYHARSKLEDFIDVAVTPEQVERYSLPHDPTARQLTVQAEAMLPAQIQEELRVAIEPWIDRDVLDERIAKQERERAKIGRRLDDLWNDYEDEFGDES